MDKKVFKREWINQLKKRGNSFADIHDNTKKDAVALSIIRTMKALADEVDGKDYIFKDKEVGKCVLKEITLIPWIRRVEHECDIVPDQVCCRVRFFFFPFYKQQ